MLSSSWQLVIDLWHVLLVLTSSDQINEVLEEVHPARFLGGDTTDIHRTLDAYRASEIVFPNEAGLEKHNLRLKLKLEHELSASSCYSNELGRNIRKEVHLFCYFSFLESGSLQSNPTWEEVWTKCGKYIFRWQAHSNIPFMQLPNDMWTGEI